MLNSFTEKLQANFQKRAPNPDSFLYLPESEVKRIGLKTHMGARIDCAVLSGFAYHYKKNYEKESDIRYANGVKIRVPKGRFVVSINTIAEDLWYRWFLTHPIGDDFTRFYEKVKKSVQRLVKGGSLQYHGFVDARYKGVLGSVWSLSGTVIGSVISECKKADTSGLILTHSVLQNYTQRGFVKVVDLLGGELMRDDYRNYRMAEMCTSRFDRNRFHDYFNWIQTVAKLGANGDRHTTTGAFKRSDLRNIDSAPSYLPYFIIDIDEDNPLDSHEKASYVVSVLDDLGCPLRSVMVCYTGGRGFHVYIPGSVFGNPVFRSSSVSVSIANKYIRDTFPDLMADTGLFNPTHLVRLIGSKHESSGLFKLSLTADQFIRESVYSVLDSSRSFRPALLSDPCDYEPVPEMLTGIIDASDRHRTYFSPEFDSVKAFDPDNMRSRTVELAMQGVSEGDLWYPEKGYSGRSMAMFVVACYLLKQYEMDQTETWNHLIQINQLNDPPLNQHELSGRLKSALNTLGPRGRRSGYYV